MRNTLMLAQSFASTLRRWLAPEQMRAVVARNTLASYSTACASHDFCDANMAMLEAFGAAFTREPLFLAAPSSDDASNAASEADTQLWNAAWNLARAAGFDGDKIQMLADEQLLEASTHAALDLACKELQDYLGVPTGDFAALHFSGEPFAAVKSVLAAYLDAQRQQLAQ